MFILSLQDFAQKDFLPVKWTMPENAGEDVLTVTGSPTISKGQERAHLGMAHSSVLLKEQFSSKLEKGLRWQMNGRCVPHSWEGNAGPWGSCCCSPGMTPALGSQVAEAAVGSAQAQPVSSPMIWPLHTRPDIPGQGLGMHLLLCCALGLPWVGAATDFGKWRSSASEDCTMSIKYSHWQVFWKDTEWLPASSSWSDHPVVVLMRFPHWCFVYAEHKQWHTMCGPRRSERVSTEPNLGWIRACYGMYIDVTFVLQRCNIWIMMSWYAR